MGYMRVLDNLYNEDAQRRNGDMKMEFKIRVIPISDDTLIMKFDNEFDAANAFDTIRDQMYNDVSYGRRTIKSALFLAGDNMRELIVSPKVIQAPVWLD